MLPSESVNDEPLGFLKGISKLYAPYFSCRSVAITRMPFMVGLFSQK